MKSVRTPYSVQMRENADQNNSEYGHFLRSVNVNLKIMSQNNTIEIDVLAKFFEHAVETLTTRSAKCLSSVKISVVSL